MEVLLKKEKKKNKEPFLLAPSPLLKFMWKDSFGTHEGISFLNTGLNWCMKYQGVLSTDPSM